MIELDLRRTRDGAIVVVHDPTLARLWGVDQPVADIDLAELREIGHGPWRIPTLADALRHVEVPLMVDFTDGDVVEGALAAVGEAGAFIRSLFVTANVDALRTLRARSPEARIGLTWIRQGPPPVSLLQELGAEFFNPMFRLVTPEGVAAVHDLGLQVSTWTVDERRHMARVCEAGVDAVVSNRIADLRAYLG